MIAEAWLKKVSDGRVIEAQDGEALQEFADDLRNCQHTLEAMGHLSEINTQRVLAKRGTLRHYKGQNFHVVTVLKSNVCLLKSVSMF